MENSLIYNLNLSIERVKIASFGTSDTDYTDLSGVFERDGFGGLEAFWCGFSFSLVGVCWLVWGFL